MEVSRRELLAGVSGSIVGGAGGYLLGQNSQLRSLDNGDPGDEPLEPSEVIRENRPSIGNPNAATKLFYWVDFECTFCYQFVRETFPQIDENFIQTEDVEFIYKPISIFGSDSRSAALGAHCSWEQGVDAAFDQYERDIMEYYNMENSSSGWSDAENLNRILSQYGVSIEEYQQCVQSERFADRLETDNDELSRLVRVSTPTFLGYNTRTGGMEIIVGAQPYDRFEEILIQL